VKKIIVALFCFYFFQNLYAQDSTCKLRVSLLTCSPGQELYSTFGHSALRVIDSSAGTDLIYNYGTFDFDDPAFYSKFTRGKLLYFVSVDLFENFLGQYKYEQRGITEQMLDLSCAEKQKLITALNENAKEKNKYYKYDFVIDNCTTRLRDIVFKNVNATVATTDIRPKEKVTFRDLIHEYLNKSHQYWSKLGIDILLGRPLDKKLTNTEAMFLPDYLLKGFDSTTIANKMLVSEKKEILKPVAQEQNEALFSPFLFFSILFLAIAALGFLKTAEKFLSVFDFILFFLTGALGLLFLFMWFGTDHPECKNNFNLVWALPLHFIIVFFIFRKWNWLKYYFLIYSVLLLLLLIFWKWLPQEMNNALIPVVCLLLLRSITRYKKFRLIRQKPIALL
jgi:hypothetical protein